MSVGSTQEEAWLMYFRAAQLFCQSLEGAEYQSLYVLKLIGSRRGTWASWGGVTGATPKHISHASSPLLPLPTRRADVISSWQGLTFHCPKTAFWLPGSQQGLAFLLLVGTAVPPGSSGLYWSVMVCKARFSFTHVSCQLCYLIKSLFF